MSEKIHYLDYLLINTNNYKFKDWQEYFPDGQIKLDGLCINEDWNDFFDKTVEIRSEIEEKLTKLFLKSKQIVPYPRLMFNSLNVLSPDKLKVVILGQDPYINMQEFNGINIPQAMGFSFSVPYGYPRPPSLYNIYDNLVKFDHLKEMPKEGCLMGWVMQGCLMINSAFTTFLKISNAHKDVWPDFTEELIKHINEICTNVVFLAWGKPAHGLCFYVDHTKHKVIYSSHPSPYSYTSTVKGWLNGGYVTHPSFQETDHFGKTNEYLVSVKKSPILWDVIDI
jgi:uracil-DNA glycosylase